YSSIFDLLDAFNFSSINLHNKTHHYLEANIMRIEIHTGSFSITDSLRNHIERRVQFTLSWAQQSVHKIALHLNDVNGPKGGADKLCRVQIPMVGGSSIVIEEIQADLYVAIDRATARAERTLARRLERKRQHKHTRFCAAMSAAEQFATS
ncbi:MAG: HPF/RaiA family ribosome-associated protein, partial [Moraxellaceae bacterium]